MDEVFKDIEANVKTHTISLKRVTQLISLNKNLANNFDRSVKNCYLRLIVEGSRLLVAVK